MEEGQADKLDAFFSVNTYVKGSYNDEASFRKLKEALSKLEEGRSTGNRLFYLALPPSVFEPVTTFIKRCAMSDK